MTSAGGAAPSAPAGGRLWLPPPGFARKTRREGARRRMAALLAAHGVGAGLAGRVMEAALELAESSSFEAALAEGLSCVFRFEPLHPRPLRPTLLLRLEPSPLAPLAEWLSRRARSLGAEALIVETGEGPASGLSLAAAAARGGGRHAATRDLPRAAMALRKTGGLKGVCVWIVPPPLGEAPGVDADAARRFAEQTGAEVLALAPRAAGGRLSGGAPAFARAGALRLAALSAEGEALGGALELADGRMALAAFADPLSADSCENASPSALARRLEAMGPRLDTVQGGPRIS